MTILTPTETDLIYKSLLHYLKALKEHTPISRDDQKHTSSMILDTMILKDRINKIRNRAKTSNDFGAGIFGLNIK